MAQLIIRNIPDSVVATLQAMAESEGMSREAYLRDLLIREASYRRICQYAEGKLSLRKTAKHFAESNVTPTDLAADLRLWVNDTFVGSTEPQKAAQALLIWGALWAMQPDFGNSEIPEIDERDRAFVDGFGEGARIALKKQVDGYRAAG